MDQSTRCTALILGCDGGLNFSYDRGLNVGTPQEPARLPVLRHRRGHAQAVSRLRRAARQRLLGRAQRHQGRSRHRTYDWFNILGFDGYYCQVDPTDPDTVYCEGQYGILRRVNVSTTATSDIKPRLDSKEQKTNITPPPPAKSPGFRFNWNSPILLSPHDPKTVYYGGNVVFRSGQSRRYLADHQSRFDARQTRTQ